METQVPSKDTHNEISGVRDYAIEEIAKEMIKANESIERIIAHTKLTKAEIVLIINELKKKNQNNK